MLKIRMNTKPFQVYRGGRRRARIKAIKAMRKSAINKAKSNSARSLIFMQYQHKIDAIWMAPMAQRMFNQFMESNREG